MSGSNKGSVGRQGFVLVTPRNPFSQPPGLAETPRKRMVQPQRGAAGLPRPYGLGVISEFSRFLFGHLANIHDHGHEAQFAL